MSSPQMQQAFEEGKNWAKEGFKQGDLTYDHTEDPLVKCFKDANSPMEVSALSEELLIFISFSIPEESLKELSSDLEKIGGAFVMRGLPHNSFQKLFEKTKSLKEKGILAPILIDPEAFEEFGIRKVPTFVLKNGESFEKYEGNVPLFDALRILSERKTLGARANKLLQEIKRPNGQDPIYQEKHRDQTERFSP